MQQFRSISVGLVAWMGILTMVGLTQSRDQPIRHDTGQSVSPSFEGWYPNPDGTFTLSFGYLNRNFEQTLDIPVGVNNHFEPGAADRGQPTHFLSRLQTGIFAVTVPADFGDQTLTWSLTAGNETVAIPGHLRPEWQIDSMHEITSDNRPPVVKFNPSDDGTLGPDGPRHTITGSVGQLVPLALWVSDDGIKKRPSDRPPLLGVAWSKYRGPGAVEFDNEMPDIESDGKAETSAKFSEPGDYIVRVLAWDDSGPQGNIMAGGFFCCWTNAFVSIRVE